MTKPLFTGLCTALVTPFLGESVNYPMLQVLIRRQIEAGAEAIVLCEVLDSSRSERIAAVIERAKSLDKPILGYVMV